MKDISFAWGIVSTRVADGSAVFVTYDRNFVRVPWVFVSKRDAELAIQDQFSPNRISGEFSYEVVRIKMETSTLPLVGGK